MMYFGTDGIRGVYGEFITEDIAYRAGKSLGNLYGGTAIVGRDTRLSGPQLESALTQGITDSGANVRLAGILPTPAVAYLVRSAGASFGVMLSASHNPPEYNGIKVFGRDGHKLSRAEEETVEYYMNCPEKSVHGGKITHIDAGRYLDYIVSFAGNLRGIRVLIDHGYGSGGDFGAEAFSRLGASVKIMQEQSEVNGGRINCLCGALYPEKMAEMTEINQCDIGFAFDGDADRACCACNGLLGGDEVLYNLSGAIRLNGGTVVGTVLTNSALAIALKSENRRLVRTAVGDKNISEIMRRFGYSLGGEPSGHYIISPYEVTGDGILTALFMAGQLSRGIRRLNLMPQKSVSILSNPSILSDSRLTSAIKGVSENVRVVVRMSGTEPKLRIMAESEFETVVDETLEMLEKTVRTINESI